MAKHKRDPRPKHGHGAQELDSTVGHRDLVGERSCDYTHEYVGSNGVDWERMNSQWSDGVEIRKSTIDHRGREPVFPAQIHSSWWAECIRRWQFISLLPQGKTKDEETHLALWQLQKQSVAQPLHPWALWREGASSWEGTRKKERPAHTDTLNIDCNMNKMKGLINYRRSDH